MVLPHQHPTHHHRSASTVSPARSAEVSHMRKPCCDKQDTNKGAWSKQEDERLINYIRTHGEGRWRSLPEAAGLLRCGKSCRLRWINYLRPDLKRGSFTEDEEDLIIKLHALLGNRWSLIAGRLPGRTDNEIKNYWNSHLRRKLTHMGIDPNNHRPSNKSANCMKHWPQNSGSAAFPSPGGIHTCSSCAPPLERTVDNDRVSDEASGPEDSTRLWPALNLDLNISLPSPPHGLADQKQHTEAMAMEGDAEDTYPTLHLFT